MSLNVPEGEKPPKHSDDIQSFTESALEKGERELRKKSALVELDRDRTKKKKIENLTPAELKAKDDDRIRRASYAVILMKKFRPMALYIKIFGAQPFQEKRRADGTSYFLFKPVSPNSFFFFLTTFMSVSVFLLMTIGILTIFLLPEALGSVERDMCDYSWEETQIARHIVPVLVFWTWCGTAAASGFFILSHGKSYGHYFTFWNKAVQRLDMDVTIETTSVGWLGQIDALSLSLILLLLFLTPYTQGLRDADALIMQIILRIFGFKIYEPNLRRGTEFCGEYDAYYAYSAVGLILQIYMLLASRCFVIQFRFFMRLLTNACTIWNQRLYRTLSRSPPDITDPTKRRTSVKNIMGDHLNIVQLFKQTDSTFKTVIQVFYFTMCIDLCLEAYYISRFGSVDSCLSIRRQMAEQSGCSDVLTSNTSAEEELFINCDTDFAIKVQDAVLCLALILETLYLCLSVTLEGSNAYQEGMRGWRITRRHGFMFCRNRKERNFIHSLCCSFAPNNPMQISGGGYFNIGRPLVIVIFASVLTYFVILLQFRPSDISVEFECPR